MKKLQQYTTEQLLNTDINSAWNFFSSAKNLSLITPPALDFKILTKLQDEDIYEGMLLDYTVKPLLNIKVNWQSQIMKIDKPHFFIDRQLKGPYRTWEHIHLFIEKSNGVLMKDQINYQLPYSVLGNLANSLVVRQKIEEIFEYRKEALDKMFNESANNN